MNELEEVFYKNQIPALIGHLERIASALERHVELAEERQTLYRHRLKAEEELQSDRQEQRRKKFEANLQKLAEVDRMARELRRKLEEKRAEAAGDESDVQAESSSEAAEQGDLVSKPAIPEDN